MHTQDREAIDRTIETVAVRRLGIVAAAVTSQADRDLEHGSGGLWYLLWIRTTSGGPWSLLVRRRTKAELLTLVSTAGPERLGIWPPFPRDADTIDLSRPRGPNGDAQRPRRPNSRSFRGHGRGWRIAQMEA